MIMKIAQCISNWMESGMRLVCASEELAYLHAARYLVHIYAYRFPKPIVPRAAKWTK